MSINLNKKKITFLVILNTFLPHRFLSPPPVILSADSRYVFSSLIPPTCPIFLKNGIANVLFFEFLFSFREDETKGIPFDILILKTIHVKINNRI